MANLFSTTFATVGELSDFCKVLSQFAFCNILIIPLPKSQTRHPARTQAPLFSFLYLFSPHSAILGAPCAPTCTLPLYYEGKAKKTIFPKNFMYLLRTTRTRHMVSFIAHCVTHSERWLPMISVKVCNPVNLQIWLVYFENVWNETLSHLSLLL